MMLGPYDEGRARGEAANYPGGFAVGFATSADRGDFLRRWEDAARVPGARAAIVAQLAGEVGAGACARCGADPMPFGLCECDEGADAGAELPARGGFVQHAGAVGCDDCERSYGPGALCRCEAERCDACGAWVLDPSGECDCIADADGEEPSAAECDEAEARADWGLA
jgi:hypothetical protein